MSNRRDQLEAIATKAVQQNGLNNLSFRTLADEVGVKSSSVHYYFPEKADLTRALIEKYSREFFSALESISQADSDPKIQLRSFVQLFENVLNDERLCLCGMLAAEVSTLSEENRALLTRFFTQAEDWLYQLFEQHKQQLIIATPPKQLAKIILSSLEGAMLIDRVENSKARTQMQYDFIEQLMGS